MKNASRSNTPQYYDYGYMPAFITEVIARGLHRSMKNQLRETWNRYDFTMGKGILLDGNTASIVIQTADGPKNYKITVKEVK